jgi:MFS family permease
LRTVLRRRAFRRLLEVRIISQFGDGLFQAALAGGLLFNPEKGSSALAVAIGFAVLLVPYSIVGPFVGVFLDRWSRRTVIYTANLLRAGLVLPMAALTWYGQDTTLPYALGALLIIGLNRFVLAGLSASQPHVVPEEDLVTANATATTLGTVCYSLGLGVAGLALNKVLHQTFHGYTALSLVGGLGYAASALVAYVSFTRPELGPDEEHRPSHGILAGIGVVARGMVAGVRHLGARPVAAYPMIAQALFRYLYGVLALSTLLLYRRYFYPGSDSRALAGLAQVVVAGGLGSLLAAFLTPPLTARIGGRRWITVLIGTVGVVVFALGLPFQPMLLVVATFFMGLAAQGTKIVVDTTIQQACADDYRGRVFSINDTSYNLCFVLGLFTAAVLLPETGHSVLAILLVSAGFLALTGWYGVVGSHTADPAHQPVAV